jgi:hypothetical protein
VVWDLEQNHERQSFDGVGDSWIEWLIFSNDDKVLLSNLGKFDLDTGHWEFK